MSMLVGAGYLFNAQAIGLGAGTVNSTPGNISGKKQISFKLVATAGCTVKIQYANGDPTNSNTQWYPSPTSAIASITLTANTPVMFTENVNAGWVRATVAQQGGVNPTLTTSFETKAQD